jgi:hypothetical protein
MKNVVFWDVTPCGSYKTDVSRERIASHIVFLCSVPWLLVTANVVPNSPILVTLMMEPIHSLFSDNILHFSDWLIGWMTDTYFETRFPYCSLTNLTLGQLQFSLTSPPINLPVYFFSSCVFTNPQHLIYCSEWLSVNKFVFALGCIYVYISCVWLNQWTSVYPTLPQLG